MVRPPPRPIGPIRPISPIGPTPPSARQLFLVIGASAPILHYNPNHSAISSPRDRRPRSMLTTVTSARTAGAPAAVKIS